MTTNNFLETNEYFDSDCVDDDDSDYIPSSDSDSGDEVQPSPRKKRRAAPKFVHGDTPTSSRRCILDNLSTDSEEDDIPLAKLIRSEDFSSSDDEPLVNLRNQAELNDQITEQELSQLFEQPMWTKLGFESPETGFRGEAKPPPEHLKEPIEYFRELVTNQMIEDITYQTNLYSVQSEGKSVNASKAEIDLFIGIYLRMGLIQMYAARAFWAEETRCEKIADFCPRNRFEKLASRLHFIDNLSVREEEKRKDKLWKLRPWLDGMKASLDRLHQEEFSSVDEVMIPFKGRSHMKQYMRNKPHKWGFKLWGRAGASGTLYEFNIYQGASENASAKSSPQLSKTADVVMSMTSNIPDGQNFKVCADNFFTSLPLVEALKDRAILYVGTVRVNRLKGCTLQDEKSLKKAGRGAFDALVDANSGTVAVRWFDNRTVDLVSSYVGTEPVTNVQRYDKKEKKIINVPCPAIVKEYNRFMGGIDLHDMLTALYRYPLKAKRWYMYIFYYTIHMMVVNAWLQYRKEAQLLQMKDTMRLAVFQSRLAMQLVAPVSPVGRPRIDKCSPRLNTVYRRRIPPRETRLDGQGHLPEYSPVRGRCKEKDCEALTFIKCAKCSTYLCLNKERNCYSLFHLSNV